MSLSCDGREWSELTEVAPSMGRLGRTHDHPVDGLLIETGGARGEVERASILIHRDVYFIAPTAAATSRLTRIELSRTGLERLAARSKRELGASCRAL